jgi:hypothetical protein
VQVATLNDYEEGTEVETGIDNCASLSASYSAAAAMLAFAPSFSSARLPTGARSLALGGLGLPSGDATLCVEMVGKSHVLDHLSALVASTLGE